jgi:hypothetical protein
MTMRKKNATQSSVTDFSDFGYEYTPKAPARNWGMVGRNGELVNPLVAGLEKASNVTVTENAAKAYKSTMDHLLDFFGNAGAMRKRPEIDIIQLFSKAFAEDRLLALKALFYIRDVRGGQGERRTFRICLKWLADNYPDLVQKNILNVPLFGRWDDLYTLFHTTEEAQAIRVMATQLAADWRSMKAGKNVSLLAKWLKSENTSSPASRNMGRKFREALGWSSKKYRKTLSALREYIDVVEVKMCAREWNEINFEQTPSKALLNYRKAFEKRANESFAEYLKRVEKGEAKIATGALYPYDILRTVVETGTAGLALKTADLQWRNLPNYLEGDGKGLVIADTSGSMHGLPLYVAVSLAMYFAERNMGPFKDVFMTFSQHPCFHRLVGNNILEKWLNLDHGGWDCNTDLQAALDLILNTARANRVLKKDMPSTLFIVSDMQFDRVSFNNDKTNFEVMKQKFEAAGYELPKVVWWQVDARQNNVPVTFSDAGVALVSGSHPSILKKICTTEFLTPLGLMLKAITDKRYDSVVV